MLRVAFAVLLSLVLVVLTAPDARAQDPFFTIDGLNDGLPDPGAEVDRRTPRAAMQTFLEAAEREDWAAAAHVLDLADLSADAQPTEGPILAMQLHSVIERKAILDWTAINDRPDALQVLGGQNQAQAGEPRRSLLLRELSLDPVPASIRLDRVRPSEDAAPIWVFSRETVADVPALYRVYGPSEFESLLPSVLLSEAVFGLMWWELLGLPLVIVAAISLAMLTSRLLSGLAAHTRGDLARRVLRAVATPVVIVTVTTFVWWLSREIFVFSGQIDIFLAPAIAIGFVTATLLLIVNIVEAALDHLMGPGEDIDLTSAERDDARALATKLNAGKRILVIVVFLLGAGVVLTTANAFRSLGISLVASAGALTLILGFAARNILGNVMASLQIALNQSARVGDRVVYKGELCHVERIHMTFVQLRDWDGTRVIVPVEEFVSETFSNWSLADPAMLRILKFKLAPSADVEALRKAFLEIVSDLSDGELSDDVGDVDEASVNVAGQDVFGIDVWFSLPCTDPNTSWEVACTVRERLVAAANRIEEESGTAIFPEAVAADAA
ncbi:MAG: mechanosensitive ion channel domain-containing protein [Jannaschia sp.]